MTNSCLDLLKKKILPMLLGFADSATVKERRREREDKKEDGEQGQELNEKVAGVVAPRRGRRRPIFPKGSLLKKPQQPRLACLFFPCGFVIWA